MTSLYGPFNRGKRRRAIVDGGKDGEDGDDGKGISSFVENSNGTFTLNYTDNTSFTSGGSVTRNYIWSMPFYWSINSGFGSHSSIDPVGFLNHRSNSFSTTNTLASFVAMVPIYVADGIIHTIEFQTSERVASRYIFGLFQTRIAQPRAAHSNSYSDGHAMSVDFSQINANVNCSLLMTNGSTNNTNIALNKDHWNNVVSTISTTIFERRRIVVANRVVTLQYYDFATSSWLNVEDTNGAQATVTMVPGYYFGSFCDSNTTYSRCKVRIKLSTEHPPSFNINNRILKLTSTSVPTSVTFPYGSTFKKIVGWDTTIDFSNNPLGDVSYCLLRGVVKIQHFPASPTNQSTLIELIIVEKPFNSVGVTIFSAEKNTENYAVDIPVVTIIPKPSSRNYTDLVFLVRAPNATSSSGSTTLSALSQIQISMIRSFPIPEMLATGYI